MGAEYIVLSTSEGGQYVKLDGLDNDFLIHRKYLTVLRQNKNHYVCIQTDTTYPNLRLGEIYTGKGGYSTLNNPNPPVLLDLTQDWCSTTPVPKRLLSKVRNWDEAKETLDILHTKMLDNALKRISPP